MATDYIIGLGKKLRSKQSSYCAVNNNLFHFSDLLIAGCNDSPWSSNISGHIEGLPLDSPGERIRNTTNQLFGGENVGVKFNPFQTAGLVLYCFF